MLTPEDLIIDPEFQALLPPQTDDEREALRLLLEKEGYRDRIVVWLGHSIVIDGMSRFAIWDQFHRQVEDRQPEIVEKAFPDREAVARWIIRTQLGRRNLQAGQRALLAMQLKGEVAADAKRRQKEGSEGGLLNSAEAGRTVDKLAEIANVSPDSIQKAETVVESGNPEVIAAVQAGQMSLNAAAKEVKPPRAPRHQDPAAGSDRAEKAMMASIDRAIDSIRQAAGKLQDDQRAELIESLKFLLGQLEGER